MTAPHLAEPTIADLLARQKSASPEDLSLAARYAPLLQFDAREPFLPQAVGFTIFRTDAPSPSFPRRIELAPPGSPPAAVAIEYAIWWDWDIQHLYELEHVWVYLDGTGRVVRAEASWHGRYHSLEVNGQLPLEGQHIRLFSEPGKHAFAPVRDWLVERQPRTRLSCTRHAGMGGVWVTPLFEQVIKVKTPQTDRLVHTYLSRFAFEPTWEFSRQFPIPTDMLVPWPALHNWIPARVAWWVARLEREIPPEQRRFLRIAHRGASEAAPENTLTAIVRAAERGADMVELDVHLSGDAVPVVIHDPYLARTTTGQGMVRDTSLADLKRLDAGQGETIPTLEEAILCCREQGLGLYLEIKDGWAIPASIELLRRYHFLAYTIVTSFRPDWLAHVKALEPALTTSVLFGAVNVDPVALARSVGATYVHPAWEALDPHPHRLLTPEWIQRVRDAGLGIIIWHEERPEEIAALRRLGVDGICSNTPERLL